MTIAYVVLSHRNPAQVLRLVGALAEGPAARVLVRHDRRHSRLTAAEIEAAGGGALVDDIEFDWGGWSHVELILRCLERVDERHDPDWTLILSGQDYPVRALAHSEAELAAAGVDARLGAVRAVEDRRPQAGDEFFLRCRYRHFTRPRAISDLPHVLRPVVYARDVPRMVGVRRVGRAPLRLYASSDWLTLGRRARAALRVAAADRGLMRYFRRVAIPSESFFASVLLADASLAVERDHRRFARFSHPRAAHPDTLTSADLDSILASRADFARKFDAELDERVLDLLDEHRRSARGR